MSSSTPSAISRYRPAILVLVGAAAAYTAVLIYDTVQSAPQNGLQRSNAVRRRRQRDVAPARLPVDPYPQNEISSLASVIGTVDLLGTAVQLNPRDLIPPAMLRQIIVHADPSASEESIQLTIGSVYDTFLDLLLLSMFGAPRVLEEHQVEMVHSAYHTLIPDGDAIPRAVTRFSGGMGIVVDTASVAGTEVDWGSDQDTEGNDHTDGQTLQRTLYHIAEDRARQEGVIHRGITCNSCDEKPIRGIRWHCANCVDFDLCSSCEATNSHHKTHIFYKIRVPAPYLALSKQEPLYPGKPHMMSPSIDTPLKRRLVADTTLEAEEIEALWDQFTCLAASEWPGDPCGVKFALDRCAFNHAFTPRFSSFTTAPNLIYDRIFAYYDTDKNGLIGFEEWIKGIDGMHEVDVERKAKIVFNGYDIDEDGYVSRKDILRIFRAFYAIEKEATRNYVAELTEDLSVRTAMDTIRSSQPLGSAFPPPSNHSAPATNSHRLLEQKMGISENTEPVLDDVEDIADRDEVLRATDLGNIMTVVSPQHPRANRAVRERWTRRQFYIDEEEGLTMPEGLEPERTDEEEQESVHANENDQAEDEGHEDTESGRPRWSRSSSRVRFQDDVDIETRSNASTSSRPLNERWGGYEIPEPEKDLGQEVLYQITQQGFNELLDPLFQEKEDMAIDAQITQDVRKKFKSEIIVETERLGDEIAALEMIHHVGIYAYAKGLHADLMHEINEPSTRVAFKSFRDMFRNDEGSNVEWIVAGTRLSEAYTAVESHLHESTKWVTRNKLDRLTLWNTKLLKMRLQTETIEALIGIASKAGWIVHPIFAVPTVEEEPVTSETTYHDPTLPQFRPNSTAEETTSRDYSQAVDGPSSRLYENDGSDNGSETTDSESDGSSSSDESLLFADHNGLAHVVIDPEGPFFAAPMSPRRLVQDPAEAQPEADDQNESTPKQDHTQEDTVPQPSNVDEPQPVQTRARAHTQEGYDWSQWDNTPVFTRFQIDLDALVHVLYPSTHKRYKYSPDTDPTKATIRGVRRQASDPESYLYVSFLASLQCAEKEDIRRGGLGRINYEEFAEHMRSGKLRYLEAWMDWISI